MSYAIDKSRYLAGVQDKAHIPVHLGFTVLGMPRAPDIAPGRHCTDPLPADDGAAVAPRREPIVHQQAQQQLSVASIRSSVRVLRAYLCRL